MQDYYCLLTHGFKTEKCFTAKEPFEKIENYLKSHSQGYKCVFDQCNGIMQVPVYQYDTLYMETFIIHRTRDLQ